MKANPEKLRRLETLYDLVAKTESANLRKCVTAVNGLKDARNAQRALILTTHCSNLCRMPSTFDSSEAVFAIAQCDIAMGRIAIMNAALKKHEEQCEIARQKYFASRLKHEQMVCLLKTIDKQAELEAIRKDQADTDEMHLTKCMYKGESR